MYYINNRPAESYTREELYDIINRRSKQEMRAMQAYCMARNGLDRISECLLQSRLASIQIITDMAIKQTDAIMETQLELFG